MFLMSIRKFVLFILIIAFTVSCETSERYLFELKTPEFTGVHFSNQLTPSPEWNILSYLNYFNGAGVAVADFNNDQLPDIYLVANRGSNHFYLNRGNWKFTEHADKSGIKAAEGWKTGVTVVDINADGWMDIYLSELGQFKHINGRNKLFVNQGPGSDGVPVFIERAKDFGLDLQTYATQAAFFDFDLDGDLDLFQLNHSVHPIRNYGNGKQRLIPDSLAGDRFLQNDEGKFIDITAKSGIFSGKSGYGLGLSVSDFNNDGYPDLYIGNDFYENDYLYLNQKNGTFREVINENNLALGHTTHSSMGNTTADLNNDGWTDIISLDMLPEDRYTYLTSAPEYPYQMYWQYMQNGYQPQYIQNTFHLNLSGGNFSEIAYLAGMSATEWSWSPVAADFDNDGETDLYITNGIPAATNDLDYIKFISNQQIQMRLAEGMDSEDMDLIHKIPTKKTTNYFFQNQGDLTFRNRSSDWIKMETSFSNSALAADFDNDGDLDLVVNNIDEKAYLLENKSEKVSPDYHYLKVSLKDNTRNIDAVGGRVLVFLNDKTMMREKKYTNGYLSGNALPLHFGLGSSAIIDSVVVIWPGGYREVLTGVKPNHELIIEKSNAAKPSLQKQDSGLHNCFLADSSDQIINFTDLDFASMEFQREPLMPYQNSSPGPAMAIADINDDGLEDLFIGGAKRQTASLFVQNSNHKFELKASDALNNDRVNEDSYALFIDADNDGDPDLIVGSGGNEFTSGKQLSLRYYRNEAGEFIRMPKVFEGFEQNVSTIQAADFNRDGNLDLFVGVNSVPGAFGQIPSNFLFENKGGGMFTDVTSEKASALQNIGLVYDASWADLNNDNYPDLVVAGHFMPVSVLYNRNGILELSTTNSGLENTHGFWNELELADIDLDGDLDIIAGNWGMNSRLRASEKEPIRLYSADFDNNGSVEPILTYFHQGKELIFANKDELSSQLPIINKNYLSHADFARAELNQILPKSGLEHAERKQVNVLKSSIFINNGDGKFSAVELPVWAQFAPVWAILFEDINNDGIPDLILGGNTFGLNTQLGRMDGLKLTGLITKPGEKITFEKADNLPLISGEIRDLKKIKVGGNEYLLVSRNNETLKSYRLK